MPKRYHTTIGNSKVIRRVPNIVSVTGSSSAVNVVAVTGSTEVLNTVTVTGSTTVNSASYGSESTVNTTTATLAGDATYTGTGEQNSHPQVGVYSFADVAGTLYFDWSVDGTNWNAFPTSGFTCSANIPEFHTAVKLGRHFRVRYVNGSDAQSTFRLTTYYGSDFVPSVSPLNQPYALDSESIVVRPTFPWLDAVRGLQGGITFINKFGRNSDCSADDTIWAASSAYTTPSTASTLSIFSSSGADKGTASPSSGALTIKVFGLDENYALAEETVTLDGTSSVTTSNLYWFMYRSYVETAGSEGTAVGTITLVSNASGSPTVGSLTIGFNQTQIANYQIPAGHTGYFNLPQVTLQNTNNNAVLHLGLFKREFGGVDRIQTDFLLQSGATADYQQKEFGAPLIFNEKDIIFWKVLSLSGGGIFNVAVDYDIWLVNET